MNDKLKEKRIDIRKWRDRFTTNQKDHIKFARIYTTQFNHPGIPNGMDLPIVTGKHC